MDKFQKYNTTIAELTKLIIDMSESQQQELLSQAHRIHDKRENFRNTCLIYTEYIIQDQKFNGFILDINLNGAYIETDEEFIVGNDVRLLFHNPFIKQQITLSGEIIWNSPSGMGVRFRNIASIKRHLKQFLSEIEKKRGDVIQYYSFLGQLLNDR
jgi:Tfp pilus assembly protein PilZ